MARVLIIEDEPKVREVMCDFLEFEGYDVLSARDGVTGLKKALTACADVIILDIMLPRKNGYDVCRAIREAGLRTPIVMVTAKGEEIDKVRGLELGADEYVTKPVGLKELGARIRAVLRRVEWLAQGDEPARFVFGDVVLDFKKYEVQRGGQLFPLSSMEAALLKYMVQHRGEVLTREQILNEVWGYDKFPTTRTVDTHVLNLRKKVEARPNKPRVIVTVHGAGYRFMTGEANA